MNHNDDFPPLPMPPPPPRRGDDLDVRRIRKNNEKDWRRYREQWQKMLNEDAAATTFTRQSTEQPPPPPTTLWTRIKSYGVRISPHLLRGLKYLAALLFCLFLCAVGGEFLLLLLSQDVTHNTMLILQFSLYAFLFIVWMGGGVALQDCAPETPLAKSSAAFWGGVFDWFNECPKIRGFILMGFGVGLNAILVWHASPEAKWAARFFLALAAGLLLRVNWPRYWRTMPARLRATFFGREFVRGVPFVLAIIAATILVKWYGNAHQVDEFGRFDPVGFFSGVAGWFLEMACYVGAGFTALVVLGVFFAPVEDTYGGADAVRDQKTYGDAKPADADALHAALQGKSADGRKQQAAEPSHDFDYPD